MSRLLFAANSLRTWHVLTLTNYEFRLDSVPAPSPSQWRSLEPSCNSCPYTTSRSPVRCTRNTSLFVMLTTRSFFSPSRALSKVLLRHQTTASRTCGTLSNRCRYMCALPGSARRLPSSLESTHPSPLHMCATYWPECTEGHYARRTRTRPPLCETDAAGR